MTLLERTRRKCLDLRNEVYPVEVWPNRIYRDAVTSLGGPDRVLLEVGCGREATELAYMKASYGKAIGLDLEIAPQAARRTGCLLIRANAHRIPLAGGSVDVIACTDVLEHLATPEHFFHECARLLRPGGHVVAMTVNKHFPPILMARLLPHKLRQLLNRCTGTEDRDTFPAYYRANTASDLGQLALDSGLEPVLLRYVSHHPTYLLFSVTLYRLGIWAEQVVRRRESLRNFRHLLIAILRSSPITSESDNGSIGGPRCLSAG